MSEEEFSFKVDCPPDKISATAFGLATETFVQILSKANAGNWRISEVKLASVDLAARPLVKDSDVVESLDVLKRLINIPLLMHKDKQDIEEFKTILDKASRLVNETGADIVMAADGNESRFTAEVLSEAQAILIKVSRCSFGNVTGKIDKLILQRSNRSIGLIDDITSLRVNVDFGIELDTKVQTLTPGTAVTVKGFIRTNADQTLHMNAEDIVKVKERHHALVTADDLVNAMPIKLSDGQTSTSLIRVMRDEGNIMHLGDDD